MRRLICAFVVRIWHKPCFLMARLMYFQSYVKDSNWIFWLWLLQTFVPVRFGWGEGGIPDLSLSLRGINSWWAGCKLDTFCKRKKKIFYWLSATNDTKMSHLMTKPTKWHMRPAKTQISLSICSVLSESSLSAWRKLGSLATQSAQRRLIRLGICFYGELSQIIA